MKTRERLADELRIKLDGDFSSNPYHPTWELRYLDPPPPQEREVSK